MSRRLVLKHPIPLVGMLVCVSCLLIVIVTVLELPEPTRRNREMGIYHPTFKSKKVPQNFKLGKFGEMMVEMLPQDLAFTIFIPSGEAFKRDLHLSVNESLETEKFNDTYAILTRILGFSAVPRELSTIFDHLYFSKVRKDPWILLMDKFLQRVRDGAVTNNEMVVPELINDRSWNINLLLGATDPQNLSIVQNIPLSHAGRTDKLIWAAVKDGIYNDRLGIVQCYKLRRKKEYLSVPACFHFSISKLKALANSLEAESASKN